MRILLLYFDITIITLQRLWMLGWFEQERADSPDSGDIVDPKLCMENPPASCADSAMKELERIPLSIYLFLLE